jgi:hypothetical protein
MIIKNSTIKNATVQDGSFPIGGTNMLLYLDAGNTASYSGSGTTWYDLSGRGNNTTGTSSTSPTYSSSNGGYFNFAGANYFQTTTSNYNVTYTGKTTFFAAQLASAMTSGSYRALFGAGGATQTRNFNTYLYYTGSAYQIHFSTNSLGGLSPNTVITPGTWFTVAVTQNSSGLITWYCNGVALGTTSSTLSQYVTDTYEWVGASDNYWNGNIGVVAVYGSALNAQQIKSCHNSVCARYSLGTV